MIAWLTICVPRTAIQRSRGSVKAFVAFPSRNTEFVNTSTMAEIDWTIKGVSNREYRTGSRFVMSLAEWTSAFLLLSTEDPRNQYVLGGQSPIYPCFKTPKPSSCFLLFLLRRTSPLPRQSISDRPDYKGHLLIDRPSHLGPTAMDISIRHSTYEPQRNLLSGLDQRSSGDVPDCDLEPFQNENPGCVMARQHGYNP